MRTHYIVAVLIYTFIKIPFDKCFLKTIKIPFLRTFIAE